MAVISMYTGAKKLKEQFMVTVTVLTCEWVNVSSGTGSPFSSVPTKVPLHFLFIQARSHFHATYYFAHNCCTISLSLSMIHPYWYSIVSTV